MGSLNVLIQNFRLQKLIYDVFVHQILIKHRCLLALLSPILSSQSLNLRQEDFFLHLKRISSDYEFVKLSFRLLVSTSTSVQVLILEIYIYPCSYFVSNASYVRFDRQGSNCIIKFDVSKKTLNILTVSSAFQ